MIHQRIALVGFMASGKSTVGRALAKALSYSFVDLDQWIESSTGRTIPDIFTTLGEAEFRRIEQAALSDLGQADGAFVLATGGGVVTRPENREALVRDWQCVYLRARPETIERRLDADGAVRPLLAVADRTSTIRHLLEKREAWYAEVSSHTVNVDEMDVPEIVQEVVAWLTRERGRA
ncbi:shikimate kinase [Alicyclobacillus acidoterrestris]|nr:shikimate kinase [Alicyclobacillus acidoterrestris]EPZ48975.1 hypothetical protein N007_03805 [Alicyclobacillus acidoterrestris ATCC 49025]